MTLHVGTHGTCLLLPVHTFEFTRSETVILFSAVLSAGAKFFRPDVYTTLLAQTQHILNRAVAEGVYDVGILQAIGILVYWRETTDRSAYMKIGIAIRLRCVAQCRVETYVDAIFG